MNISIRNSELMRTNVGSRALSKLGTLLICLLVFSCGNEKVDSVVTLPFYERCSKYADRLSQVLSERKIRHDLSIKSPSHNFVRGYRVNGLLEIRFSANRADDAKPFFDTFLYECGPSARYEIKAPPLSESYLRSLVTSGPRGDKANLDSLSIQIEDESLIVFH